MVFEFLPMHPGPMSCYTVSCITIMVSAGLLFATIYVRYNSNEFRRIENWVSKELEIIKVAIGGHDEYIDTTTGVINKIHVDLEVQKTLMKGIEGDISEIKKDIAETKKDIKTLLTR